MPIENRDENRVFAVACGELMSTKAHIQLSIVAETERKSNVKPSGAYFFSKPFAEALTAKQ